MRIQWNGHLGSRLDVGQGKADDRGGTPNVAHRNGCHLSYFLLETMNRGQYLWRATFSQIIFNEYDLTWEYFSV